VTRQQPSNDGRNHDKESKWVPPITCKGYGPPPLVDDEEDKQASSPEEEIR
jgi:hypothetical protein